MNQRSINGIGMTSRRTRERLAKQLQGMGVSHPDVLEAIREVPRHFFVEEALAHRSYENTALPIGFNQTISQPYIVARMTEVLLASGSCKNVLEVGTGSGYQTAVLSHVCENVYSVERIRELQNIARERLYALKYRNVRLKHSDGAMGWQEKAPFDGIIVTAAPEDIPEELIGQLALGGRLIIPVGGRQQYLQLLTKTQDGIERTRLEAVRFVPLVAGELV